VFGKAVPSPLVNAGPSVPATQRAADPTGFAYVKRDIIRVLGTLCHGDRIVQDRIRMCGGVEVILNHCVVDERNPCTCLDVCLGERSADIARTDLREHAIFALRNLLHNNSDNQALVQDLKPLRDFDVDGVLRNVYQ